jgi:hypothetical protein
MKKLYYTLLLFLFGFTISNLHAQCLPDGITFSSQAQIDAFPADYPGCSIIEGEVIIQEAIGGDIFSLDSLYPITSIEANFSIGLYQQGAPPDGNSALLNLSGLHNLSSVSGELSFIYNDGLESLHGLENLVSVGDDLYFWNNGSLTDMSGLDNLQSITGNFSLFGNNSLVNLNGLEKLENLYGNFNVENNHALTNFSGLESLHTIHGSLRINQNSSLVDLSGFVQLVSIEGTWLTIESNESLTSLTGLENLTSFPGYLHITNNNALSNLNGLHNLTAIGGDLEIYFNNNLIDLSGLDNLYEVMLNLRILENSNLTSLEGLENLNSVGNVLEISLNNTLTTLDGLQNLNLTDLFFLQIRYNPNLTFCHINPICDYLENDGSNLITGNAPGCNSQQEVEDACLTVSVDDQIIGEAIQLYPNPTTGFLFVDLPDQSTWTVQIRDATGRLVQALGQFQSNEIDLSNVPVGLYFLEFRNSKQRVVKKVIIE